MSTCTGGRSSTSGAGRRWLLTHQAGLPVLDEPITPAEAMAWEPMVTALAAIDIDSLPEPQREVLRAFSDPASLSMRAT